MRRGDLPPPLPTRGVKTRTVAAPGSSNSNRNSLSSSLYTTIHDDFESAKSNSIGEWDKALPPAPSRRSRRPERSLISSPRFWLLMQAILVAAFAIGCVILRKTKMDQLAISKLETDQAWMRLVFDTKRLSSCNVGLDNGCLNGLIYTTNGEHFGPLTEDGIKRPQGPGKPSFEQFGQLIQDDLKTKLVIKQSAVYRVYAKVTFRDSTSDMSVETSVQMNDSIWIHCELSHQIGARATICILYGIRRLLVNDWLSFICTDKFREISAASNETFFFIERLRRQ